MAQRDGLTAFYDFFFVSIYVMLLVFSLLLLLSILYFTFIERCAIGYDVWKMKIHKILDVKKQNETVLFYLDIYFFLSLCSIITLMILNLLNLIPNFCFILPKMIRETTELISAVKQVFLKPKFYNNFFPKPELLKLQNKTHRFMCTPPYKLVKRLVNW